MPGQASELFPTEYRGMAHGISAAVGKLGALSADIIMGVVSPMHLLDPSVPAVSILSFTALPGSWVIREISVDGMSYTHDLVRPVARLPLAMIRSL